MEGSARLSEYMGVASGEVPRPRQEMTEMTTSDFNPYPDPKPVLDDETLYLTDNGAIYHGKCCGSSARFSGRDISGQRVQPVPASEHRESAKHGITLACEKCGVD